MCLICNNPLMFVSAESNYLFLGMFKYSYEKLRISDATRIPRAGPNHKAVSEGATSVSRQQHATRVDRQATTPLVSTYSCSAHTKMWLTDMQSQYENGLFRQTDQPI